MEQRATQLKTTRTQHKAKVTTSAKKLTGAIERNADMNCVQKFLYELEEATAEFSLIHDEYCELISENEEALENFKVVNGQNLNDYKEGVLSVYSEAIRTFQQLKESGNKAVKTPLLTKLNTCKARLDNLCERTKALVHEGRMCSVEMFESLSRQFNPLIKELLDLSAELSEFQSEEELKSTKESVDEISAKVDSIQLDCNMAVYSHLSKTQFTVTSPLPSSTVKTSEFTSQPSDSNPIDVKETLHSPSNELSGELEQSISVKQSPTDSVSHVKGRSDIQIKKISLPEFSGARKDWPEFKAIWRELAESAFTSKSALAYELKRSLKGEAVNKVKNVYVTKPEAYEIMWTRLSEYYDDVSAVVHTALGSLRKLKQVKEDDFKGLVNLVDEVESVHAQLEELGQVDVISTREIDMICELLPSSTRMVWVRLYHNLSVAEKVKPLTSFLKFLTNERASVARLAENQKAKTSRHTDVNVTHGKSSHKQSSKISCVVHKGDVKHKTAECKEFKALSLDGKYQALRDVHACFRCFGIHRRDSCKSKVQCEICQNSSHHTLMCKKGLVSSSSSPVNVDSQALKQVSSSSFVVRGSTLSLYAIQPAFIINSGRTATIFCDNGSNSSYITHSAAERLKAKRLEKYTLDVTTMGNISHEYDTRLYEVSVRTVQGEIVPVLAFGIDQITGPVSDLDLDCLSQIFPNRDVSLLQRRSSVVDMLLGCDYFALHPKKEVCTEGNLSIMQGELGVCLIGSHPDVREGTEMSCNMVKVVHDQRIKVDSNFVLHKQLLQPDLSEKCSSVLHCGTSVLNCDANHMNSKSLDKVDLFIKGEELAASSVPKCGGCKCGKCPSVGHTYSFKEEQELKLIQDNLRYNESEKCWYTSYPWIVDPVQLPNNYHVALATLQSTERTLGKDPQWASKYIRWLLSDGTYWCRLIMAKCRIAPMRKLSTPQMELNAAVLSARGRKVIENQMRFEFESVFHLVDSQTVLNMVNKTSTRFKLYEGVRVGEIQAATDGNMSEWAWVSGKENTADWLTRGCSPAQLNSESEWWSGPSFLYQPHESWPLKFGLQKDVNLPGEKKLACASVVDSSSRHCIDVDYSRFGSIRRVYWVIARLLAIAKGKSFKGGNTLCVTPELLQKAELLVVKDVQRSCLSEFSDANGRFRALTPVLDSRGIWVVGKRLSNQNPMTPEGDLQALLPADHVITCMLMREAHVSSCHRGRDSTLARFRSRYWTPHGSKIASAVKNACQLCKLREAQFLKQEMGDLPKSRLKPAPPFTHVMLDLFGPFKIRGEVQKRTTGKGYGVLFTDMTMRAVHVEGVFGYDTDSFLLAFSRFVSLRGWPQMVYSDPGSQLVSVDRELKDAWLSLDRTRIHRDGAENGLTWVFGPADAPWYQGAVESLIKSVKRAFTFAFHGKKFSASEFLSVCYEISNVLNERPIGTLPSVDSEISVLTPNCLLIGRATAQNPGGWQPNSQLLKQFNVVQEISNLFWQKWCELCAPALVIQKKWHTAIRNLKPGDVVLMADKNSLRGQHRIALVKRVFPGNDGKVRSVALTYKNFKVGESVHKYTGVSDTEVMRSVHKLALLVPCNDQD